VAEISSQGPPYYWSPPKTNGTERLQSYRVAVSFNEPFGSGPEPGAQEIGSVHLLLHGEVPEGRAGVHC